MQNQHRAHVDFATINAAALGSLHAILRRLLPSGSARGGEYIARNPRRADRSPGSFSVNIRTGRWADFSTGDRGGDPVSLVAYLECCSQVEAARHLAEMLGIASERKPFR